MKFSRKSGQNLTQKFFPIVVCFLLGDSLGSETYMPTFRNILSVPSSWAGRYEVQYVRKVAVYLGFGTYIWYFIGICKDARGHHFQQHLYVHSDFSNADLQKVFANKIKRV
jgi:hypothetical protein